MDVSIISFITYLQDIYELFFWFAQEIGYIQILDNTACPHYDNPVKNEQIKNFCEKNNIELLVMTASDIVFHLISVKGEPIPSSYFIKELSWDFTKI